MLGQDLVFWTGEQSVKRDAKKIGSMSSPDIDAGADFTRWIPVSIDYAYFAV